MTHYNQNWITYVTSVKKYLHAHSTTHPHIRIHTHMCTHAHCYTHIHVIAARSLPHLLESARTYAGADKSRNSYIECLPHLQNTSIIISCIVIGFILPLLVKKACSKHQRCTYAVRWTCAYGARYKYGPRSVAHVQAPALSRAAFETICVMFVSPPHGARSTAQPSAACI